MITKDNAKAWLPLVQAMAEGKTVERRGEVSKWTDAEALSSQNCAEFYRIKPEPKWRAWAWDECPKIFVVQAKLDQRVARIAVKQAGFDHVRFMMPTGDVYVERYSFETLLADWLRILEDGREVPCGVVTDE